MLTNKDEKDEKNIFNSLEKEDVTFSNFIEWTTMMDRAGGPDIASNIRDWQILQEVKAENRLNLNKKEKGTSNNEAVKVGRNCYSSFAQTGQRTANPPTVLPTVNSTQANKGVKK